MEFNIVTRLEKSAQIYPDKKAFVMINKGKEASITYKELYEKTDAFSVGLKKKGIKPGDRVVVMIPMSIELYIVLLGIIKMGGVAVFADPWVSPFQMAKFCSYAKPKAYAGSVKSHILRLFKTDLLYINTSVFSGFTFKILKNSVSSIVKANKGDGVIHKVDKNDPALITFTSGSSGIPKGANRTHGFLISQYEILNKEFPADPNDVDITTFPVFALKNLGQGITTIIPDMNFKKVSLVDAGKIIDQIERNLVNTITASPPFFERITDNLLLNKKSLELKRVLTGGAPVKKDALKKWKKVFKNTDFFIAYGSTEAEPVSTIKSGEKIDLENDTVKGICTGKLIDDIKAKIIKIDNKDISFVDDFLEIELKKGKIGELIVTGPHVCKNYYKNSSADKKNKIKDNAGRIWHRMGDTGYLDEENRFWLTGRLHSCFEIEGKTIQAGILEDIICKNFPDIKKTAAIKIDNNPVIIINCKNDLYKKEELINVLKENKFNIENIIFAKKDIPVDPRHNSKTDYVKLKKDYKKYLKN